MSVYFLPAFSYWFFFNVVSKLGFIVVTKEFNKKKIVYLTTHYWFLFLCAFRNPSRLLWMPPSSSWQTLLSLTAPVSYTLVSRLCMNSRNRKDSCLVVDARSVLIIFIETILLYFQIPIFSLRNNNLKLSKSQFFGGWVIKTKKNLLVVYRTETLDV